MRQCRLVLWVVIICRRLVQVEVHSGNGKYEKRVCVVSLYHAENLLAFIRSGQHYTTLPIVFFDIIVAYAVIRF